MILKKDELFKDTNKQELPAAFDETMEEQGPSFIYREFREGNIEVYPETPFFKTMKLIPDFIAEKMRMFKELYGKEFYVELLVPDQVYQRVRDDYPNVYDEIYVGADVPKLLYELKNN